MRQPSPSRAVARLMTLPGTSPPQSAALAQGILDRACRLRDVRALSATSGRPD